MVEASQNAQAIIALKQIAYRSTILQKQYLPKEAQHNHAWPKLHHNGLSLSLSPKRNEINEHWKNYHWWPMIPLIFHPTVWEPLSMHAGSGRASFQVGSKQTSCPCTTSMELWVSTCMHRIDGTLLVTIFLGEEGHMFISRSNLQG